MLFIIGIIVILILIAGGGTGRGGLDFDGEMDERSGFRGRGGHDY